MCDTLPVCFIVDENLIQQLGPVVKSLISNVSLSLHVCVLTNSDTHIPAIESLLIPLVGKDKQTVRCISDDHKRLLSYIYVAESRTDISYFGYSQLVIPYYFQMYPKILFMEPDQIVQHDLNEFWAVVNSENILLSAVNYSEGNNTLKTLKLLYGGGNAYNCGVMIVDTANWIKHNYTSLCVEAALKQKHSDGTYYNYYAEGAMNIALQPYIVEMNPTYNFCNLGWMENIPKDYIEAATILHWNGPRKPWKSEGLYKEYYINYC